MKENVLVGLGTLTGIGVIFGAIFLIGAITQSYTCHRYGRITGQEVQFHAPAACYVKTAHGWFTYEQIRDVAK